MTAGFLDNEYLVENCDVAILPYDKTTGMRTSICNGLGWAASADTKRPDDCWKLIEWLGSKEMQEKQAELGVTMSAYNNTSDKWVNCTDKFNLNAYLDITKDSTVAGVTNELAQTLHIQLNSLVTGSTDILRRCMGRSIKDGAVM